MEITLHMLVAISGGTLLIGYLIGTWQWEGTVDKLNEELGDCAVTIEDLVASNDAADSLIDKLRSNIEFMDSNAGKLLEKNTELQRTIREHEAIFGPDALVSYKAMAEHVSQLEALLQLRPEVELQLVPEDN